MNWEDILKTDKIDAFNKRKKEILEEGGHKNVFTAVYGMLIERFEPHNPARMFMLRQLYNMEKAFEKIDNKEDWNKQADKFALFLMEALNNIFDTLGAPQSAKMWLKEKDFYFLDDIIDTTDMD